MDSPNALRRNLGLTDLPRDLVGPRVTPKPRQPKAVRLTREEVTALLDVLDNYLAISETNVQHFCEPRGEVRCWEAMCRRCQTDRRARECRELLMPHTAEGVHPS